MELGIIRRTKACEVSLPTELHEDILVCLRVKDLLRFRAVCKPWKSLIDSSSFKIKHLHFAQKNLSTLLLCREVNIRLPSFHFLFPHTHQVSPSLDFDFIVDPTFIDETTPDNFHPVHLPNIESVRVANGLVLLGWNDFAVIWNPISNEFKKINPPPLLVTLDDCLGLRVGYSAIGKDSWKIVSVRFPFVFGLVPGDGYMDGKFYWFVKHCVYKEGSMGPGIVSFDFTNENFELIPLPRGLIDEDWLSGKEEIVVVTSRGCLELIKSFWEGEDGRRCEIWGMGEDGSWSRKLGVSLPSGVGFPLGVLKDGQLVCGCLPCDHVTDFRPGETSDVNIIEILLFNPKTGGFKNLGYGSSRFRTCTFVESLFSIH